MYKAKHQFLENQMRDAQDRNAMAEQQHREHMAYGELEARTELDIINDSFQNVRDAIGKLTSNPLEIGLIMQIIEAYGDVREAFGTIPTQIAETFGSALTDEERAYVTKMHP